MNELKNSYTEAPLTAEQKLAKRKEQNRLSQTRFREAHREQVNAMRRKNYQCNKEQITQPPAPPLSPEIPQNEIIPRDGPTGRKVIIKRKKITQIEIHQPTITDAISKIGEFETNKNNVKNYKSQLNKLKTFFGDFQIKNQLENHNAVIEKIKTIENNNSKKATIQTVLKLIGWYPELNIDKKEYLSYFNQLKAQSHINTRERNETEQILDFDSEYLPMVLEKSDNEKFKLLIQIFDHAPVRDDYQLIITDNENETKNKNNNYIRVYTKNRIAKTTVYINTSKTSDKYQMPDGIDLPPILSQKIKKYIKDNNLKKGDYLFIRHIIIEWIYNCPKCKIGNRWRHRLATTYESQKHFGITCKRKGKMV
jgi:hypothetical protein